VRACLLKVILVARGRGVKGGGKSVTEQQGRSRYLKGKCVSSFRRGRKKKEWGRVKGGLDYFQQLTAGRWILDGGGKKRTNYYPTRMGGRTWEKGGGNDHYKERKRGKKKGQIWGISLGWENWI